MPGETFGDVLGRVARGRSPADLSATLRLDDLVEPWSFLRGKALERVAAEGQAHWGGQGGNDNEAIRRLVLERVVQVVQTGSKSKLHKYGDQLRPRAEQLLTQPVSAFMLMLIEMEDGGSTSYAG